MQQMEQHAVAQQPIHHHQAMHNMPPNTNAAGHLCRLLIDRIPALAISKGLPPPPKASGFVLLVCAGLLVRTVALPSLTAVCRNPAAVLVSEGFGVEDVEDVEDVKVGEGEELRGAVRWVTNVEWRTMVVVNGSDEDDTEEEGDDACVVMIVLVIVDGATEEGCDDEVGIEEELDTTIVPAPLDTALVLAPPLAPPLLCVVVVIVDIVVCEPPAFGHSASVPFPAMNNPIKLFGSACTFLHTTMASSWVVSTPKTQPGLHGEPFEKSLVKQPRKSSFQRAVQCAVGKWSIGWKSEGFTAMIVVRRKGPKRRRLTVWWEQRIVRGEVTSFWRRPLGVER